MLSLVNKWEWYFFSECTGILGKRNSEFSQQESNLLGELGISFSENYACVTHWKKNIFSKLVLFLQNKAVQGCKLPRGPLVYCDKEVNLLTFRLYGQNAPNK